MRTVDGDATVCATLSANNTAINPIPTGGVMIAIYVVVVVSAYAPIVTLLYIRHRQQPSIKYRNPNEMAFTAIWAYLYVCARCFGTLYADRISCFFRYVSFGVPLNFAFVGYMFAELRVVSMFKLTELMVAHAQRKFTEDRRMGMLRSFVRSGLASVPRVLAHVVLNIPLMVLLLSQDISTCTALTCPHSLVQQMIYYFYSQLGVVVVLSIALSFGLSQVIDNFHLRRSFQLNGRLFLAFLCVYMPLTIVFLNDPVMNDNQIEIFVNVILFHIFLWIHIAQPVWDVYRSSATKSHAVVQGTVHLLDAYLHTEDGFRDFSTFAKPEFMYECVVAWKNMVDYRVAAPNHLTAIQIYDLHMAPNAPLRLDRVVPATILTRYELVFAANHKYQVSVGSATERDHKYFDMALHAIRDRFLAETLPRYQRHPLGAGWREFVEKFTMQSTFDKLVHQDIQPLQKQKTGLGPKRMPSIKPKGALVAIDSARESQEASSEIVDHKRGSHVRGTSDQSRNPPPVH
ncbi:Aste57867_23551 [Aphanomyces stellatus]|uniref:Aste57867_23551 protein n=1 Tax=Aphanomyces stellatus TaxID=120398 RepID=A0A485LPN4_9STRA|nr:hypothetical protein As57867_023480 [Aphanomyces stellatus]VFU00196.1 Aste57867_23551 [Aphanomyces stellatus]